MHIRQTGWIAAALLLSAACAVPLAGNAQLGAPAAAQGEVQGERTAGDATAFTSGRNAFSLPLPTLTDAEVERFSVGNSFFRRNWVAAPASTTARDGLGPHFIARSCGGCHVQDGRGAPPDFSKGLNEPPVALLLRVSIPGKDPHGGPLPDPVYGDQINNAAVPGVLPEADIRISYRAMHGEFADGTPYALQKPAYRFAKLNYGPLAKGVMVSPRIAPQLAGVGLLDAIASADIVDNAARQAAVPGPIKGQANTVWDAHSGEMRIGRFGWKANTATIAGQTAAAFVGDIGITSSLFPKETCTPTQKDCLASPSGAKGTAPELDDHTLANVVFYQSTLAPAARRNFDDVTVARGQTLFAQAQCAACHRPSYLTAQGPFPALTSSKVSGQRIWPYTDLLLHDMGPGLADGRPDFQASRTQWKTPPLWGIGLIKDVNGHQRLLHDGRADGVLEAILWHGGEATASQRQVIKMTADERRALVKFVESL
jgi:CxxC motif-containing protein (DUF1111 family)